LQPDEAFRFWFAFVLYSVKRLSEKNGDSEQQGSDDNGVTLCQILKVAKLKYVSSLADFLFPFLIIFPGD
jgi:retinoblastoma-like protein 1